MKLYNKYLEDYINLNPALGSIMGMQKYDKFYTNDLSDEYISKNKTLFQNYLLKLSKITKEEKQKDIYYSIFEYYLKQELNYYNYKFYLMPLNPTDNRVLDFIEILSGEGHIALKNNINFKDMVYKIDEFCIWCDSAINRMSEGIKKKYVISKIQCEHVIDDIKSILKKEAYYPKFPNHISKHIISNFKNSIVTLLEPKLKELIAFLVNEYYCNCNNKEGLKYLPNGHQMYQYSIELHTTQNELSISNIHKLGLSEVKRLHGEMLDVQKKMNFKGSTKEFQEQLKNNKNNYFTNEKDLLEKYKKIRKDINKNVMEKYFYDKISHDYTLKSIAKYKESSTSAYYMMPSHDLKRKGIFYYDANNLKGNPKNEMYVLSLHEGNPGHHYQLTYCIDNKIPKFLFYLMANNAYIEGWALYCEHFMDNNSLLEWYGKLNYEMIRSVRLVIDTGIHYYGWSFQKAYDYYDKYIFSTEKETKSEILRYISLPGQALSYKIGEIYIKNLLFDYFKSSDEPNFNEKLKMFHHEILKHGPLPLSILKRVIN